MYMRALEGVAFSELRDEEIGGQLRSYELFFNPIRDSSGITGVAVFGKDVTARRRTQVALRMAKEEAEHANKAKSQFLANMSHELRTPLNSVIGFTNILLKNRNGHLVEQELGFLERISANGLHLLHLINQILDLAKIEAGRMELDLQPVDMRALLGETLSQMEGQVKEKPMSLRAVVPEGLPPLETDGGMLKQVIINLVGNAIKFTEAGEVAVEVLPEGEGGRIASIVVRDTGIGIPPERLRAIFEAFLQADGTTRRKSGGTGLGLTISRSLCQLLGYELTVESEVGKGSAFSIVISEQRKPPGQLKDELMAEALKPMESSKPRGTGSGTPAFEKDLRPGAADPPES
jgi:signal transduction histidine kinase